MFEYRGANSPPYVANWPDPRERSFSRLDISFSPLYFSVCILDSV